MIIALASPRVAVSIEDGLARIERLVAEAAARGAKIVCFPEAYLPGLRGQDFEVLPYDLATQQQVLERTARIAREQAVAVIMGMETLVDAGRQIAAAVFDDHGELLGFQIKSQLDPTEDRFYVPGASRRLFEIGGLKFGIAICHEGWRYPETVRWAASRGAQIVFHPQHTGTEHEPGTGTPYYPIAMRMRSIENTIYFASVNYALRYPESATSLIAPDGECIARLPDGEEGVLVHELDLDRATGLLAKRYAPERYV